MENELTQLLGTVEEIYDKKTTLETELAALAEDEKKARIRIGEIMGESGTRSQYSPNRKVMAFISESSRIEIVDEPVVMAYLKSNGLLAQCLRLDQAEVKRLAKVSKMPGTQVSSKETLNIKEVKDKIAQVTAEESAAQWKERINAR